MLLTIAIIAGKSTREKLAWFIYCFGIWDIFYYVFLKLLINWPDSILSWDILFLIPLVWIGPVIAPALVALLMVIFALILLQNTNNKPAHRILAISGSGLLVAGSIVVISSFTLNFAQETLKQTTTGEWLGMLIKGTLYKLMPGYAPLKFNWPVFLTGFISLILGITLHFFSLRKTRPV